METAGQLKQFFTQNLENPQDTVLARGKIMAPPDEIRPSTKMILRVTGSHPTPEQVSDWMKDSQGFLRKQMALCTGSNGLFVEMGAYGIMVVQYAQVGGMRGEGVIHILAEDLPYTRADGMFLETIDDTLHESPAVFAGVLDRLYSGLFSYVMQKWYLGENILFDNLKKRQYYYDRKRDQILLFDLDPYVCHPVVSMGTFVEHVGVLLSEASTDILLLQMYDKDVAFPLVKTVVGGLQPFVADMLGYTQQENQSVTADVEPLIDVVDSFVRSLR